MHDKLNRIKQEYESTPIPDELNGMVDRTIASRRTFLLILCKNKFKD